jgi:hypothetical protein
MDRNQKFILKRRGKEHEYHEDNKEKEAFLKMSSILLKTYCRYV